jgi:hypothetical protein
MTFLSDEILRFFSTNWICCMLTFPLDISRVMMLVKPCYTEAQVRTFVTISLCHFVSNTFVSDIVVSPHILFWITNLYALTQFLCKNC